MLRFVAIAFWGLLTVSALQQFVIFTVAGDHRAWLDPFVVAWTFFNVRFWFLRRA